MGHSSTSFSPNANDDIQATFPAREIISRSPALINALRKNSKVNDPQLNVTIHNLINLQNSIFIKINELKDAKLINDETFYIDQLTKLYADAYDTRYVFNESLCNSYETVINQIKSLETSVVDNQITLSNLLMNNQVSSTKATISESPKKIDTNDNSSKKIEATSTLSPAEKFALVVGMGIGAGLIVFGALVFLNILSLPLAALLGGWWCLWTGIVGVAVSTPTTIKQDTIISHSNIDENSNVSKLKKPSTSKINNSLKLDGNLEPHPSTPMESNVHTKTLFPTMNKPEITVNHNNIPGLNRKS